MTLNEQALTEMVETVREIVPTVIVHPEDADSVKQALDAANGMILVQVQINALQDEGVLTVFQGQHFNLDLGVV